MPHSVDSPLFDYHFVAQEDRVHYITWPLHAHLSREPTNENLLQNKVMIDQ